MAESSSVDPVGRPKLTASEKKRRIQKRRRIQSSTSVMLGHEFERWQQVKTALGVRTNHEVASALIDCFEKSRSGERVPKPGPSGLATSTPGPSQTSGKLKTPSASEVSEAESAAERKLVLSGVEEMDTEEDVQEAVVDPSEPSLSHQQVAKQLWTSEDPFKAGPSRRITRHQQVAKTSSSFVDPFEISIDVTTEEVDVTGLSEESDMDDPDDPDYEPSILIEGVLSDSVNKVSEEVAYEEAEFGLELEEGHTDESESEEESDEGIARVSRDHCEHVADEDKCIAFVSQLKTLARKTVTTCKTCRSAEIEIRDRFIGSTVYLSWVCKNGHITGKWCSQPLMNRRMSSGDFLACGAILLSGNNYGKVRLWAKFLNLGFPSADKFHRIQRTYYIPVIDHFWASHQQDLLVTLKDKDMVLLGDGRNDSPGHCAQYCSYTFIELETKKIVSLTTMDKRVTDRKSGNMEKVCFESSVDQLQQDGVKIKEVVTDAHMGIKALMKSKYTDIHHSHDIWHVAKNLGKKLSKISVKKSNKILQKWNKHIINHFWFVCKTVNSYADFMGLWSGVLHHIVDEHEWAVPNGDNGISYCLHGPLTDVDPEKTYLCRTRHESVLRELSSVLYDKRLLGNVEYYLNFRSTADLEGFHQHILMYCAKRFAYTPPVYRVRNLLAAIDHNMHVDRELVYNKDGTMSLNRVYNKKSGRWSVYPRKTRKEYTYISGIQTTALRSRLDDKKGMYRKSSLESDDPRRLSGHLAPVQPKATSEIFQEQKSRYK